MSYQPQVSYLFLGGYVHSASDTLSDTVLLSDYLAERYIPERPGLSGDYRKLLAATARKLCAWSGHPLDLEAIDRPLLANWVSSLLESHRPATINKRVRMVRTLMLAAYDDGLTDRPPRRVRKLQERLPLPEAWTVAEVRTLLEHLAQLPGQVGTHRAADWWTSLTLATYWTGCRIGALLRVRHEDYRPGVGVTVTRQKNGRQQWYRLPPACCQALERILPTSGPIWLWPGHPRTLWLHFRRHVETAGIPCPRTGRNLFHRLRRTNATYCWAVDPAVAQRQMDHSDGAITRRSYVDPRLCGERSAVDVLPDPTPSGPRLRVVG